MRNTPAVSRLESVDRALQLLVRLRDGGPLSVTSAAQYLQVVPSTAHRLLGALCDRGFAVQNDSRLYQAGPELTVSAKAGTSTAALRKAARPALQWLSETVEETTQLMVLKGPNIEFIDGVESDNVLRVTARTGELMPAYCSAGGKALLAELDDDEINQVYHRGLTPWRTARITDVKSLLAHLAGVRRLGYGVNVTETEDGVHGVGVCVRDDSGESVAALTLAIPSSRFNRDKLNGYVDDLRAAAEMVRRRLTTND